MYELYATPKKLHKKSEEAHRAAQPPTLAAFLPWGIRKELAVCPSRSKSTAKFSNNQKISLRRKKYSRGMILEQVLQCTLVPALPDG